MTAVLPAAAAAVGVPMEDRRRRRRTVVLHVALVLALVVVTLVAGGSGQLQIPLDEILGSIAHRVGLDVGPVPSHPRGEYTLWNVRFSWIAMAVVVGASLAVAGAAAGPVLVAFGV